MSSPQEIKLRPIGTVHRKEEVQVIELYPEYADGLLRIEEANRLQILFWMHRLTVDQRTTLTAHPHGDTSNRLRGVFALRSPMRPNPIGSTVVRLQEVEDHQLRVRGLDAEDGSPVIDIKIVD